jgi:hypothetical protein
MPLTVLPRPIMTAPENTPFMAWRPEFREWWTCVRYWPHMTASDGPEGAVVINIPTGRLWAAQHWLPTLPEPRTEPK